MGGGRLGVARRADRGGPLLPRPRPTGSDGRATRSTGSPTSSSTATSTRSATPAASSPLPHRCSTLRLDTSADIDYGVNPDRQVGADLGLCRRCRGYGRRGETGP